MVNDSAIHPASADTGRLAGAGMSLTCPLTLCSKRYADVWATDVCAAQV